MRPSLLDNVFFAARGNGGHAAYTTRGRPNDAPGETGPRRVTARRVPMTTRGLWVERSLGGLMLQDDDEVLDDEDFDEDDELDHDDEDDEEDDDEEEETWQVLSGLTYVG